MEAAGNSQANNVVVLPRRAGRPLGSKNRRTVAIEALLQPAVRPAKRLVIALLKDESADMELRVKAAQLVLSYIFGKPRERTELTGKDGAALVPQSRAFTKEDAEATAKAMTTMLLEAAGKS
jgi:hypothetical protein